MSVVRFLPRFSASLFYSFFLCLFVGTGLVGCGGGGEDSSDPPSPGDSAAVSTKAVFRSCGTQARPLKVMPLGDSITEAKQGYSSYRRVAWKNFAAAKCSMNFVGSRQGVSKGFRDSAQVPPPVSDFDLNHEGHWDYTVDQVLPRLGGWISAASPDVVMLHLGSNDLVRDQGAQSTLVELGQVIDTIHSLRPEVVIVVARLIPAEENRSDIAAFNAGLDGLISSRTSSKQPIRIVDLFSVVSVSADLYDGIHPNANGERKIGDGFANGVLQALAEYGG